jgi:hypothetical protein
MAVYGRFEAVEELASSGPFALFSAREQGQSGPPLYAIKIYRTADTFADEEVVQQEAAAFLEAAQLQASLPSGPAGGGEGHWAPIHESGRTAEAVFYVTDLYPTTVQRMIDSRRELDARSIAHIIDGVVCALTELAERAGGRGHGELKPSNVLVGRGEVDSAQVALTDPEPSSRLANRAHDQDLRELAGLLFQMVIHRPPPKGGAISTSPEWQRMGAAGEQLRQLCETLLNPEPGAPLMSFDELRSRLAACLAVKEPKKAGLSGGAKAAIAAVLLLALGVGGYFALVAGKGPPEDPRGTQWALVAQVDDLEARKNAAIKKAADNGDEARETELTGLDAEFKALDELVNEIRSRPAPKDQAEVRSLRNAMNDAEAKLAALDKKVAELDAAIVVIDPEKDPRPDKWMEAPIAELAGLLSAVLKDCPSGVTIEGAPDPVALQIEVDEFIAQVNEIRARPWEQPDLTPVEQKAAQAELHRAVKDAILRQRTLKASLTKAKAEARDVLTRYVRSLEQQNKDAAIVQSVPLREAFAIGIRAADPERYQELDWAGVKSKVEALTGWLKGLEEQFAVSLDVSPMPGSAVAVDAAVRAVDARRERALASSVEPMTSSGKMPGDDPAYAEATARLKAELTAYIEGVKRVLADAVEVERLLSLGYAYEEAAGDKSIKSLHESVNSAVTDGGAYADIRASVESVLGRAADLQQVATVTDGVRLINLIARAGQGPGGVSPAMAAWNKLPEIGFPAVPADLDGALRILNEQLIPALAQVSDAARRAALESRAKEVLKRMWTVYVLERSAGNFEAVNAAFSGRAKYGVADADIAQLPAWARYNFERWKLLQDVAAVNVPDPKEQIKQLQSRVLAFNQAVAGLGLDGLEAVNTMGARLKPFAEGKDLDLTREGPGRLSWTTTVNDADGYSVTYSWKGPSGRSYSLEFRRVHESADAASYLCTTEVSAGLFIDLVDAYGKWDELKTLTNVLEPPNDNRGPRVVRWTLDGKLDISRPTDPDKTGKGWHRSLAVDDMLRNPYYPPGGEPERGPDYVDPVDYISPSAAIYVSRLLGCRLPSSEEWKAALAKFPARTANLRDAAYAAQHAHISRIFAQANKQPEYPNYGMLKPTPAALEALKVTIPPAEQDGQPAVEGTDGYLFFAPVDFGEPGDVFRNLIGNVWEFVYEAPAELDALAVPASPADVTALTRTREQRDKVRAIGGSALSPKELPVDRPIEFNFLASRAGFTDAGFRLAFSTGAGTGGTGKPAERLAKILSVDYLPGANP